MAIGGTKRSQSPRTAFLTTKANAVIQPIHPKAMPVILTTDEERDILDARVVG
jgi:putative SOS response-associated peptidase YedK